MVFVLTEPVFAKKAGKAKVAVSLMKRPGNVCPTVLEMVILTWRLNIANVMKAGLVTIVHQNYAILIVDHMDGKNCKNKLSFVGCAVGVSPSLVSRWRETYSFGGI